MPLVDVLGGVEDELLRGVVREPQSGKVGKHDLPVVAGADVRQQAVGELEGVDGLRWVLDGDDQVSGVLGDLLEVPLLVLLIYSENSIEHRLRQRGDGDNGRGRGRLGHGGRDGHGSRLGRRQRLGRTDGDGGDRSLGGGSDGGGAFEVAGADIQAAAGAGDGRGRVVAHDGGELTAQLEAAGREARHDAGGGDGLGLDDDGFEVGRVDVVD